MRAAVYGENGPVSVFRYEEAPDPEAGAGEVLIQVEAISIEGGDLFARQRQKPSGPRHIEGYQAAGRVIGLGDGASRFSIGDRVATFNNAGAYAERRAVPEHYAWRVPDGLDIETASTIPVTFGTADDALFDVGRLKAGETVLVQGAAGGVGLAAVQLAKAAGAVVLATSSSDANLERLADFGVDHGINYRREDVTERCLALTGGKGVELILDMAGGAAVPQLIRALAYRGRLVSVGASSGEWVGVDLMSLVVNGLTVSGLLFGREMHTERARALIERHLAEAAAGRLRMPIHRTFPLSEVAAAQTEVERGHPFGRVVMIP